MTVRGKRLLERAEVVFYDYLASKKLLNHVPVSAERIYVGKKGGVKHTHTQDEINQMLVDHAQAGKFVVRLKGGDPFIFGRGERNSKSCMRRESLSRSYPGLHRPQRLPPMPGFP
nr:SAM-dependent methyltransferase [Desulfomarina profundi]